MMSTSRIQSATTEVSAVVAGAATSALLTWISNCLSDKYSKKQKAHLHRISELYLHKLKATTTPEIFILDDHDFPRRKFDDVNTFSLVNGRSIDNRVGAGRYFANAKYLVGSIESYLKERHKRTFGSGKSGDVLSLVLIEWLEWANNDLPTLGYNEQSLQQLLQRNDYLSALIKDDYFRYSSLYRRGNTKFDTFIKLQRILKDCIEVCKEEANKQSIRDYLANVREIGVSLSRDSLNVMYLSCNTDAYSNTFIPSHFVRHDSSMYGNVSHKEYEIYNKSLSTLNGKILKDIILASGLNAPGFPQSEKVPVVSHFYDANGRSRDYAWNLEEVVDFPWNKNDSQIRQKQITIFQKLGEAILSFTQIIKILDLAYDIVGGLGDRWASEPAKVDFLEALKDLDFTLQRLVTTFAAFLADHEALRDEYNHLKSINGDSGWNANFTQITQTIEEMKKNAGIVSSATSAIKNIIQNFPSSSKELVIKELSFINEVRKRKGLKPINSTPTLISNNETPVKRAFEEQVNFIDKVNALRFPILKTKNGNLHIDKPILLSYVNQEKIDSQSITWSVGDNYSRWCDTFTTRNKDFFVNYNVLLNDMTHLIETNNQTGLKEIKDRINSGFSHVIDAIDSERPKWRFKYFIIPITLGFPFNIKARQFATTLDSEMKSQLARVNHFIEENSELTSNSSVISNEESLNQLSLRAKEINLSVTRVVETVNTIIETKNKHNSATKINWTKTLALLDDINSLCKINESKEENDSPLEIDDSKWLTNFIDRYRNWRKSATSSLPHFFTDKNEAVNLLKTIIFKKSTMPTQLSEIVIDDAFRFHQEIDLFLQRPTYVLSSNNTAIEELTLLNTLLKAYCENDNEECRHYMQIFEEKSDALFAKRKAQLDLTMATSKSTLFSNTIQSEIELETKHLSPSNFLH